MTRVAASRNDWQGAKFDRFIANMSFVAVAKGVEAGLKFKYSVKSYGVGDLVKVVDSISDIEIAILISEYDYSYTIIASLHKVSGDHQSLIDTARLTKMD